MANKNAKKNARRRRIRRRRITLISVIAVLLVLLAVFLLPERTYRDRRDPVATVTLEGGGRIVIELFPKDAPASAAAFIALANGGAYDGQSLIADGPCLLVQGAPFDAAVKGEFADNGFENPVSHERGVIGLSRKTAYDSATGGFYLMLSDAPYLDGANAAFGKAVKGMEIADEIAAGKCSPVIESIRVDTKGRNYGYEK